MNAHQFIYENHPGKKIKVLIISSVSIIFTLFLLIAFYKFWFNILRSTPIFYEPLKFLIYNISNTTPVGLFFGHLIGSIFFVISADELVFYYGLMQGNPPLLSFIAAMGGYMIAQLINYLLGLKLSNFLLQIVSKKKVYKTKRWINKYGVYGIFIFNILPLPAPVLVFALGITKYNFKRLFIVMTLAKILEYLIIIGIFFLFS